MATSDIDKLPLIVVSGPTASGKTALAVKLARYYGGEIICADSRTVYRGMDIGTAKPTQEEQMLVPHWGLDLVDPGDRFTVSDFKSYAKEKIRDIRERGKIPFLVGGTGLYIDAVVFDFGLGDSVDEGWRQRLEVQTLDQLLEYCKLNNIILPENQKNKRYVIRAIERQNISVKRQEVPTHNSIIVAITTEKKVLRDRIELRAEQILSSGVVEETTALVEQYGWDSEAMTGNIYPLIRKYLQGDIGVKELRELSAFSDWGLAKRQLTWLRRNPYILWADLKAAEQYLSYKLAELKLL